MKKTLLFDTDVLIDALRGHPAAVEFIQKQEGRLLISVLTLTELFAGVRGEKEKKALSDFTRAFEPVPVNPDIAVKSGLVASTYSKSHGIGLADAVIAATAEASDALLVTLNKKHVPMLKEVLVPYTKK